MVAIIWIHMRTDLAYICEILDGLSIWMLCIVEIIGRKRGWWGWVVGGGQEAIEWKKLI